MLALPLQSFGTTLDAIDLDALLLQYLAGQHPADRAVIDHQHAQLRGPALPGAGRVRQAGGKYLQIGELFAQPGPGLHGLARVGILHVLIEFRQ